MRRNYIDKIIAAMLLSVVMFSCRDKTAVPASHAGHKQESMDSSMNMITKPTNEKVIASIPAIKAERGTRIHSVPVNGVITYDTRNQTSLASRVSGRIERLLIKYNYQPVQKGQLIMEIYSPDLAAAQRELIYVANNSPELLPGAKQRLLLLGMSSRLIEQVIKTGQVSYRVPVYSNASGYILEQSATAAVSTVTTATMNTPAASGNSMDGMGSASSSGNNNSLPATTPKPVMIREGQYVNAGQTVFTIYQATKLVAEFAFAPALSSQLSKEQKLLFSPAGNKNAMQAGRIGLIEPVFRNGQNFLMARVYLGKQNFQAGQLLSGSIPIVYTNGLWLPQQAVWRLGARSIVFRKDNGMYTPAEVQTGAAADGFVQILTDITHWEVAANAGYLIDSESFIKAKDTIKK